MTKRIRFLVILVLLVGSGLLVWPTVNWYFFMSEADQVLANAGREEVREYVQGRTRDAILEIRELAVNEPDASVPEEYEFLIPAAQRNLRQLDEEVPAQFTVLDLVSAFAGLEDFRDSLEVHYLDEVQQKQRVASSIIQLGLDLSGGVSVVLEADRESLADRLGRTPTDEDFDQSLDVAVQILRNRVDQFGLTEPEIRRQDDGRIVIDLPGEQEPSRVNSFIMGRGSMAFQLVDEETDNELQQIQDDYLARNGVQWEPGLGDEDELDFVPVGTEIVPFVETNRYGIAELQRYVAVKSDITENGLDGIHIDSAQASTGSGGGNFGGGSSAYVVLFQLDDEGTRIFGDLTTEHQDEPLAVVMDDEVRSVANINGPILNGQVQISGNFTREETEELAVILRTASLPIDLEIISLNSIGSSLGAEAINAGLWSIAIGMALVVLFMLVYYQGAGLIADIALVLNLVLIVSILSALRLTLTLTSIAGIILTVGMAVDANVIIFERIREEYRLGKGPKASIAAGFQKAFWTIIDANITTFIAALFLSVLGNGPVAGFAVTLAVGIVSTLITALFVARFFFDFSTDLLKPKRLSIGWGVK